MNKRQKVIQIIYNDVEETEKRKNNLLLVDFFKDEYIDNLKKLNIIFNIFLKLQLPNDIIQKIIFFNKNNIIQERISHVKYLYNEGYIECHSCGFYHHHSQCRLC